MTTTSTAASVYQQLRNHLTDLKLADAADALPRVLDQAHAAGRPPTPARARPRQREGPSTTSTTTTPPASTSHS